MSLEDALDRDRQKGEYAALKARMPAALQPLREWTDQASKLHAELTDATEKAEVLALRDQLVTQIRQVLGL